MDLGDCSKCGSSRILYVAGKTDKSCSLFYGDRIKKKSFVPDGLNIGFGDFINVYVCLDCGHLNGEWPVPESQMEEAMEPDPEIPPIPSPDVPPKLPG